MSETYKIHCVCENCGYNGEKELPKGTPVPNKFLCPNCGCETAKCPAKKVYRHK
jgi:predicted RNA-binding Zn-ribbon protein involved in translation (DUF1610 family)